MTIQDQITALMKEAEPLRVRHDGGGDELRLIVEEINVLRRVEATGSFLTTKQQRENKAVSRALEDLYGRKPNPKEVEFFTGNSEAPKRTRKQKANDA